MHTARYAYVQTALPAYTSFMERRTDRDIGDGHDLAQVVTTCDALLNLPDYLTRESPPRVELAGFNTARAYRESLWPICQSYELVCDVANAYKHRRVTRTGRRIEAIEDVQESCQICRFKDPSGEYYRTAKAVLIKTIDGRFHDARRVLTASMQLWARELVRLNVVPATPDRVFAFSEHIARDDPQYLLPLRAIGTVGEPFSLQHVTLDYSESLGRLVEVQPGSNFRGKAHFLADIRRSPFDAS
jgi:hypothetical protein